MTSRMDVGFAQMDARFAQMDARFALLETTLPADGRDHRAWTILVGSTLGWVSALPL